ncbi:MAG: transglycosylase SLT domain-containing protein [Chloroflexota bacterium]
MTYRILGLLMAGVLVLAACSPTDSAEADVTYVIVTGEPVVGQPAAQQITPTPPLPTASPATPTPDIPPEITLQIADRYLLNGRYEDAVFSYQIVLDQSEAAPADLRAAAAFGMGQAALREGLFERAVDAMTILISQFPQDFRAVQAYFLRGDAYMGLSQWQQAVDDYRQYLVLRPGIIDSYAYERIGDALINLNRFEEALASYDQATAATRSTSPQAALMEKVARLYRLNNQVELAIEQYDGILAFAQNRPYRAFIMFTAGEALLEAGDMVRGLLRMEQVFTEYEDTAQAYAAMQILLENDRVLDPYRQGRVSYFAEDYESAIEAFNVYTAQTPLTEIPAELHLLLGRAYRAVGNDDAARIAFQTIIDQFPSDPLFGDALLEQGRTFFIAGEIDQAIARYLEIANTYGDLAETAAEALWRAAYLYGTNDNAEESRDLFIRLADTYPDTEQARSGLTIAAAAAVSTGQNAVAETLYARLAELSSGSQRAEALLQLGRLALDTGAAQQAQQALSEAIAAAPESYFSARAQDLLAGRAPFSPPAQYVFEFDDLAEVTEAENWLRTTFGVVQDSPLWPLSPVLEQDPRVIRGRELWAVGAFDAATIEFLDVIDDYSRDGLASYQLAIYMRIIGAYRPSIVAAANLIILSGQGTLNVPPFIARLRYPFYYGNEIRNAGEEYGFDPLILASLIRQESLFDTNATAAADEKGLTQVIPSTAAYIAEQLQWPDYEHSDLFRPYAGIAFGAFFLSEQLNRFDNSVYPALAAYNAGPGRAIDWLELSGGDPDRFMATITISSTRTYIQRIYGNYNIYRALYGRDG